jgi:hypothetical protein
VRRLVQLRHATSLTSEAYLAEHAWVKASLATCPRHPGGGCGFARHGTYPRKTPTGMRVTRDYCPTAHETFSLLPDCLASRFPSDLDDLERVAVHVAAARSVGRWLGCRQECRVQPAPSVFEAGLQEPLVSAIQRRNMALFSWQCGRSDSGRTGPNR